MDYAPFMAEVLKLNYGGFASIEWFGADPTAAAKNEIAYLNNCWGDHRKKEPATIAVKARMKQLRHRARASSCATIGAPPGDTWTARNEVFAYPDRRVRRRSERAS